MSRRRTRNDRLIRYCLLDRTVEHAVIDENGNETGEVIPHYGEAVSMWANVSPATGQSQTEQFGNLDNYDKVIMTADMSCPIDENTVLFVDKPPEYSEVVNHELMGGTGLPAGGAMVETKYRQPKNDYIVKRVAKSLNSISIAIRKVEVG